MNQMASALFKMVAALGRNMIVANTFGAFAMLVFFALGGVVLSRGMCSCMCLPPLFHIFISKAHQFSSIDLIKTEDIKKWWIWGYWISPIMYGQNAIVANEFFGHSWSRVSTTLPCPLQFRKSISMVLVYLLDRTDTLVGLQAVPNSNETLGVTVLKSRGFLPHAYWYWIGTGALLGFVILFNFGFTLALTFLNCM